MREMLFHHWPRKLLALTIAVIVWILVNNSITDTKTFDRVAVKIINLPIDKTVPGLLPSGILDQRITLTLSGSKKILDDLISSDIEVMLDASDRSGEWVAEITRKSIVYRATGESLASQLTKVEHTQLVLKTSRLISAKVPVHIKPPQGEPPRGYLYLNVWPRWLWHTISGPEEMVEEVQASGLSLSFDLDKITKEQLDQLESSNPEFAPDEVNYLVPSQWKRVAIPFHNNALEELNDPDGKSLHIEFLRKELLPLNRQLPVQVFFSPVLSGDFNPESFTLSENGLVGKENGIHVLQLPLYVRNVSRLFLDIVRDHLQLVVIGDPSRGAKLRWSMQIVDPETLENLYVSRLASTIPAETDPAAPPQARETHLRQRFRDYMRHLRLMKENEQPLKLDVQVKEQFIQITEG